MLCGFIVLEAILVRLILNGNMIIFDQVINPKRTDGYGNSADIWSLGCTVLEMLTGKIPYCDLENPVSFQDFRTFFTPVKLSVDSQEFVQKLADSSPVSDRKRCASGDT